MTDQIEIIDLDFDNRLHCDALVNLMNEYITDKMGGGDPYTEEQKKMLIKGLKDHPSTIIYLARSGGQFIGLVSCFVNFATFTVKPFVNVHDIIVTQTWRNKGIGRKLLERVLMEAGKLNCSKVTLEVREDNLNARHLYQSLGFNDADPRQFYWARYM